MRGLGREHDWEWGLRVHVLLLSLVTEMEILSLEVSRKAVSGTRAGGLVIG